jgi:hypothetical protein
MDSICPRCGAPLQSVDHAPPLFCGNCGLPQLRVSEDALNATSLPPVQTPAAGAVNWPRAFRIVAATAAVGVAVPSILPGALASGAIAGVSLLMTPVLALASVFAYGRGRTGGTTSTSAGAHIGAVLGLVMGALIAFVTGVAGFVLRYGYHSHAMDDTIGQAMSQMPTQLAAQMASVGPPPPELLAFIASPEFRAGSFMFGHVFWLLVLVAVGSACGWMSSAILRARQPPDAG